MSDISDKL